MRIPDNRALLLGMACVLARGGLAHADRPSPGSISAERLKVPSGPSSVRGLADEPQVDPFNAQLDYQVPIELPNGLGGLTPSLTLTYSGALGNGAVGIGWSLSHAQIRRSTRLGVPRFDDNIDQLEISGIASGRLVSIGNGEYRVEGMGQTVRVKKVDGGFQVDDGKGVTYRLGTSATSRQGADATHIVAWLVESETNLMGEQIAYQYTHDQNQVYLSKISWGPSAAYNVSLAYESRIDPTTSYRSGFVVTTAQRLATITLRAFGAERRAYRLSYDPLPGQPAFPVARLSGVTSTGENGDGSWPSLSFTYAAPAAPAIAPIAGVGVWRLNQNGTTLVDLDGDGAADLLQAQSGGHSYRLNQNGTFGNPVTLTGNSQALSALQLQDVDGDARPELLQDGSDGWSVWKWSKSKWNLQPALWPGSKGLPLKDPAHARFADLNGDGLIDGITWNSDGLNISLGTRTGISASTPVGLIGGAGGGVTPTIDGRFQDVNGDGLDDYTVIAFDHLDVYVGHGDGTFEAASRVLYPFAGSVTASDIELADLDRDGLMDLIKIETGQVRWFPGRADGTFSTNARTLADPETLSSTVTVAVADTNGNGSQDIVWSSASNMWRLDLAGTTTAGMLVEVENGLGLDVTFDYQSSHALEVAAAQAGSAWTSLVPIAMPVSVKKTTALGAGEQTRLVNYSVRDGFWDATEQRFGGFLSTIVTTAGATPAQTSSVTTRYNKGTGNDREMRGTVTLVQVRDGANKLLSATSNDWTTMAVSGLPDTPLLRRAILRDKTVEYDDVPTIRTTDVTYTYDAFGRAKHVVDSGRNDVSGDESVTDTTYADDDTTWIRDQVCEEKVSSLSGTVVSDVQHLFGDDQKEEALCVVGKGWPREARAWFDAGARWVTQTATTYDSHGNPKALTDHGVTRTLVYDANGLFPIEEHLTAPGHELVWTAGWDEVLGVMTSVLDPNGHTTHLSYDNLGRYTGTSIDDRPEHVVIEYDLTPPYPKTTQWTFDGALADAGAKPDTWSAKSGWRQTVEVHNGLGEVRYHAQRLADAQWIISDYHEVDPNSRVVFAGRPVFSSVLELSARPSGIVGDTLVYDPLGRLIEQDLPTGTKRTSSYVSFERTTQDADLAAVHSVLDGQGRAILTERSLADGTHEIVKASYDAAGRLTTMTLADGAVTRTFTYDTLGRLETSQDPDLGVRTLTWDDGNRLTTETNAAGQVVRYGYDVLGRLITRDTGVAYGYHYDDARPGAAGPTTNLLGQLAWTEEPTGGADLGYDELGRTTFVRRRIDAEASEATISYAASGLVLGKSFDDGFAYAYHYDPVGRLVGAGDLWTVLDQTATGAILHEKTQNGVDTTYGRDVLDLVSQVTVRDVDGIAIYDVSAARNPSNEITSEIDHDGHGLDHGATFGYDGFSRLTSATIGSGAQASSFGYAYDALHNMTSRTGPVAVGAMFGTYHYAEHGRAPRQLTSITGASGAVTHTFDFDAAGRQIAEDALRMTFDASDRVTLVTGLPTGSGTVVHAYGQDGERVKTVLPDGSVSYFFGDGTALRNGTREHDVTAGDRVVARVTMGGATGGAGSGALGFLIMFGPWGAAGVAFAVFAFRPTRRRRVLATAMVGVTMGASCASSGIGTGRDTITSGAQAIYLHDGFSAGPVVFSDALGHLLEERRYEPFGAPIDAHVHAASGDVTGKPDLVARDLNPLNKRTEAATGWSDHGARWMAPETGRWLSTDPPVTGPDASFMAKPWALHPYQYVDQNPVACWDPHGRQPEPGQSYVEGKEPADAFGNATGLYGYGSYTGRDGSTPGGLQAGAGLVNGGLGAAGVSASALHADAGIGRFVDSSGTASYGVDAQVGLVHVNIAPGGPLGPIGLDFGVANGEVGAYANKSSAFVGAEFNVADAAITLGSETNSCRLGASFGVGLGARLYYGVGSNGERYLGVGADAAFGIGEEVDVKVEVKTLTMAAEIIYKAVGPPEMPIIGPPEPSRTSHGPSFP